MNDYLSGRSLTTYEQEYLFQRLNKIHAELAKDFRWPRYIEKIERRYRSRKGHSFRVDPRICQGRPVETLFDFINIVALFSESKSHFYKWIAAPYLEYEWRKYQSDPMHDPNMDQTVFKEAQGNEFRDALGLPLQDFKGSGRVSTMTSYAQGLFPEKYPRFPNDILWYAYFSNDPNAIRAAVQEMYTIYLNRQEHITKALQMILQLVVELPISKEPNDLRKFRDAFERMKYGYPLRPEIAKEAIGKLREWIIAKCRIKHSQPNNKTYRS